MEQKEVEKKTEQTMNAVEAPEFEAVWERIEPRLKKSEVRRKARKRWLPVVVAASCAGIVCAVAIPTVVYGQRETETWYYSSQLLVDSVTEDIFYTSLENAGIEHVDFSGYYIEDYQLFMTEDGSVKGGILSNILDDADEPTCLLTVQFFDSSVRLDMDRGEYTQTYTTESGAEVCYELGEYTADEGGEAYNYLAEATWKDVTYLIDYTAFSDNVTEFFEVFFR